MSPLLRALVVAVLAEQFKRGLDETTIAMCRAAARERYEAEESHRTN